MFRKFFREFFMLPRGEQRALLLLSLLLVVSMTCRIAIHALPGREPSGMEQFIEESRKIMASIAEADSIRGLTAGIYPLGPENRLERAVHSTAQPSGQYYSGNFASLAAPVNINKAYSVSLLPLPGIGPVFAGRIVKYRKLLGGFVNTGQLSEVYGLEMETVARIAPLLSVDPQDIIKLKVNSASFRDLLRHPYLEFEDVKAMIKYREVAGRISSLKELRQNLILPDSVLVKTAPYFDLSD